MSGTKIFKSATLSVVLSGVILSFPVESRAQGAVSLGTEATSVLLSRTKELLKANDPEALLPYLREILVRLEGMSDKDSLETRSFCLYQAGVCEMQTKKYPAAIKTFAEFLQDFPRDSKVPMASLMIAESYAMSEDWKGAEKYAQTLMEDRSLTEERQLSAWQLLGEALYYQEKWNEASLPLLKVFEQAKESNVRNSAAVMLVTCYMKAKDFDNFLKFLGFCDDSVRQTSALNLALIEAGDQKFKEEDYPNALVLYRSALKKGERVAIYERQMAELQAFIDRPYVIKVGSSKSLYEDEITKQKAVLARKQKELKTLEEGASYDVDLDLRIGQCYSGMKRNVPAYTVYKRLYTENPKADAAETARFQAFVVMLDLQRWDVALTEAEMYLERYPTGPNADDVSLNQMQVYLQSGKIDEAQAAGFKALETLPNHRFIDQIKYLLAYIYFQKIEYADALGTFQEVHAGWPKGMYREASEYWIAMSHLFLGHFEAAAAAFEGYLRNPEYREHKYAEDSSYRLGIALYGAGAYQRAESAFRRFIDTYEGSDLESEALSMIGDLRGAEGELDVALSFYERALQTAISIDQINYATFQMAKTYELDGNYSQIILMMKAYKDEHGEDGNFSGAAFWIGKSYKALGKNDQAIRTYLDAVVEFGDKLENQDVDLILKELIQEAEEADAADYQFSLEAQLAQALRQARDAQKATLTIRLETLFAYITTGITREEHVKAIFDLNGIQQAGPLTLLLMATESANRGKLDMVHKIYQHCLEYYGESEILVDIMNIELKTLYEEGKYDEVIALAEEITNRFGYRAEVGLTRKLKADALRMNGQFDLAIETYEELFKVREWRGPLTPQSLYWIGVCKEQQGHTEEALGFFKRVCVMYESYTEWMAKSYERSILCLEKMGQTDEVIATCRLMLENEQAAATEEGIRARERLSKMLPQGGSM